MHLAGHMRPAGRVFETHGLDTPTLLIHSYAKKKSKQDDENFSFQELEQLLEKYKSKETKKQFAEVKRELMKLEQPPGNGGYTL
jgi:hypothetical protein